MLPPCILISEILSNFLGYTLKYIYDNSICIFCPLSFFLIIPCLLLSPFDLFFFAHLFLISTGAINVQFEEHWWPLINLPRLASTMQAHGSYICIRSLLRVCHLHWYPFSDGSSRPLYSGAYVSLAPATASILQLPYSIVF